MKNLFTLALCLGCVFAVSTGRALDLKQSKVTQVVNDVQIISAADQKEKTASVNDIFTMPDILKTGPSSRAELVAPDETVTRVGANTIFSFDPANRTINLKQGSLLFHSPHGKGGGTIHTGSATASVLGTTLIITTTPSGGMKVLDLEGQVEVNFLNGLKQSLAPGHMTFVLPGGNQLAPIIVFRLDDLTKNSQLVNGFHQSLASMPLIQQQINQQLKAIQSGQLGDTGLQVGDDANSQQVQVLDLNTLQSALDQNFRNPTGADIALGTDANIYQPSLTSPTVPTPPTRLFLNSPFLLLGNSFFVGQPFVGFAGRNINFFTQAGSFSLFPVGTVQPPLTVDLSLYANEPEFDIVASRNMTFHNSVTFGGLASSSSILFSLIAGNQFSLASGITIRADVANFDWQSPAALTFDGVTVKNSTGNTSFGLGTDFTMQNNANIQTIGNLAVRTAGNIAINHSSASANTMQFNSANGTIGLDTSTLSVNDFGVLTADQTITLNNSVLNTGSGSFSVISKSGSVNFSGTTAQAQYLTVNSGDGILLDNAGQSFNVANASFTAKGTATVQNSDLSNVGFLNMVAHTITLVNTVFNPNVANNFGTHSGTPNIVSSVNQVVPGDLNLINTHLGSTAITSVGQINLTSGPSSQHGINSYATGL